ncbi:zinc-ribbon domain-containing protein [Bifidobacterium sp. ESL0763]|uniref:zinc-ribbon domain-containing protein n=1 Tax=Bifidobacterium sp. ESL0763 TaxID=2983227 RepID=UPI0023F6CD41|nr:zinc-ribbon domain-containing protein [Bifidobacterium sp. ESL0763]MDF7663162.1 zinc-ribbon domain-containing protein [Bifidobacterium sp. ESL0763]
MRFCTNCGNKLDDDARFCTACGAAQPASNGNASNATDAQANQGTVPPIPLPGNAGNASVHADDGQTAHRLTPAIPPVPQPAPGLANRSSITTAQPALPSPGSAGQPSSQSAPSSTASPSANTTSSAAATNAPAFIPAAPATATATSRISGQPSAATATQKLTKKRFIFLVAAIVAVALVAGLTAFGTHKAGLWGGKTLPSPSSLGIHKSKKTHAYSAKDVEQSLHNQGFETTTKPAFSGQPKGTFLHYDHARSGTRYNSRRNPITIVASRGPGVPAGTSGQPVQNVTNSLESMGVSVHYHKVITDTSKTREGTVLTTYPSDGQAVTDTGTGINVGVATSGDGVDYSVVGQDKDQAKQQYTDKGFHVWMAPRFSSKKMLNKIVDSQPKPGSPVTGGDLMLFYGIDASGMDKAVQGDKDNYSVYATAAPVGGTYCTKAGTCINLDETVSLSSSSYADSTDNDPWFPIASQVKSSEGTNSDSADATGLGHDLLFCHNGGDPGCNSRARKDKYGTNNELYYQDYGAFELMDSSINQITCGTSAVARWDPTGICVGGQLTERNPYDLDPKMSGASYEMRTHYVYFPVGSNVKGVVDSGYFDKAYVDKAKKQKAVDTSRPFFIRRDKSLYKTTKVDVPSLNTLNPFVPENGGEHSEGSKPVPTRPAPSDETAYYLVDQPQLDWNRLPEFTLTKSSKSSDSSKPTNDASPDQITAAVDKGDFSIIAGKYCTDDGDCIQLDKKGMLTGMRGSDHPDSQLHLAGSTEIGGAEARNSVPNSSYLSLNGPDSDYRCAAGTGEQTCRDAIDAEMQKPVYMMYVFKNSDTSGWYTTDGKPTIPNPCFGPEDTPTIPAKTDRPYLYQLAYRMNMAPDESRVYYLVK